MLTKPVENASGASNAPPLPCQRPRAAPTSVLMHQCVSQIRGRWYFVLVPALPLVPDCLRLDLNWTIEGDPLAVTRNFLEYSGGPPVDSDLNALCAAAQAAAQAQFQAITFTGISLVNLTALDLASATPAVGEDSTSFAGTRVGPANPPGACMVVHYPISRRYRGGKPRGYWPFGVAGDLETTGLWKAAFVTNCQNSVRAFYEALVGQTYGSITIVHHVNVSYYSGFTNVPYGNPTKYRRTPTLRTNPVLDTITLGSELANLVVGSQRRRNRAA